MNIQNILTDSKYDSCELEIYKISKSSNIVGSYILSNEDYVKIKNKMHNFKPVKSFKQTTFKFRNMVIRDISESLEISRVSQDVTIIKNNFLFCVNRIEQIDINNVPILSAYHSQNDMSIDEFKVGLINVQIINIRSSNLDKDTTNLNYIYAYTKLNSKIGIKILNDISKFMALFD